MTSIVESEAHFRKRCQEIGLSDRGLAAVIAAGYSNLGQLAFASGQPGQPLNEAEFQRFAQNVLGGLATMADTSTLKRLVFEGQTVLLAQLRDQVVNPDAATTRRLPAIERSTKMQNLKARLAGVVIEKALEPNYALLDAVAQQWEAKQLAYLSPEKCSSREWEITMSKTSKQLSIDSDKLLVKSEQSVPDQQVSTEMQVFEALRRSGIALAFTDSLTWEVHERYLQRLFQHMRNDAPEGYVKTTLQQVLRADRDVFLHMIQRDVSMRRAPDNTLPMDTAIMEAVSSYEVGFSLMPLPKKIEKPEPKAPASAPSYGSWSQGRRNTQQPYTKGQGKFGKGKGKTKKAAAMVPKELQGRDNVSMDSHGRRLCFEFNLGRCSRVPNGGECERGFHLCMRRGCHAPHPESEHPSKDKGSGKPAWLYKRIEEAAAAGASLADCLVIEIFARSCRVTACLRQLGLGSSFGVDHQRGKSASGPMVVADLCTPEGVALLWSWLRNERVLAVFLAPPCGSASRARQIPLKRKRFGHPERARHGPRPLRDDRYPNGLPNLSETDNRRVSLANQLYFLTAQIVEWAVQNGVIVCVENPQFSFFWTTTFWQQVAHLLQYSVFHSCQYGSARQKKTMLAFNVNEFHAINATCRGQNSKHKHAQWGFNRKTKSFATAEETAYPMGLAKMIAMVIVRSLLNFGIQCNPETLEAVQPVSLQALQKMRAATGMQSRSSRIPSLVPTYKLRFRIGGARTSLPNVNIFQRLRDEIEISSTPLQILPKGSKLLAITPVDNLVTGDEMLAQPEIFKVDTPTLDSSSVVQTWGVPWEPDAFVEEVVKAGHPMEMSTFLPPRLQSLLSTYKSMNSSERAANRLSAVKFWLKRAMELKGDEMNFQNDLDPAVAGVLRGKRILLWKQMLESIQYEDMEVVNEFSNGTKLVGEAQTTGLWPKKFKPASLTEKDLSTISASQRSVLTYKSFEFMDEEIMNAVWNQTMEEVDAGELSGPYDVEQIPQEYPLSKRFGIKQSMKVRCVDDFTQWSINACAQTCESPKPHTVDILCSMCLALMKVSDGNSTWEARSFDLKRAYRQCAIHPGHARYSYIAVAHPQEKRVRCFKMKALPFGSVMSVHSFLRISHSLWAILVSIFNVFTSNYFDDFVALATSCETTSVTNAVTPRCWGGSSLRLEIKHHLSPALLQLLVWRLIDVSLLHSGCAKTLQFNLCVFAGFMHLAWPSKG